jgi:hypothetical protein
MLHSVFTFSFRSRSTRFRIASTVLIGFCRTPVRSSVASVHLLQARTQDFFLRGPMVYRKRENRGAEGAERVGCGEGCPPPR